MNLLCPALRPVFSPAVQRAVFPAVVQRVLLPVIQRVTARPNKSIMLMTTVTNSGGSSRGITTTPTQQGVHHLPPETAVPHYLRFKVPVQNDFHEHSFKERYFSDPSLYPLLPIVGSAFVFAAGTVAVHTLTNSNESDRIVKALGHNPHYRPILTEGLGVDHETWLKNKQEAEKSVCGLGRM